MKISIIGAGAVGRTLAYSLLLGGGIRELVLVGRRRLLVEAEVMDLRHAATFSQSPIRICAGEIEDSQGSELVVICASAPGPTVLEDCNQLAVGNLQHQGKHLLCDRTRSGDGDLLDPPG